MSKNYFVSGEYNLTCDVCSKKIKAHEAKHRWDGFIVCKDDWEPRHEQDFVKAHTDKITVPDVRPIPTLAFKIIEPVFDSISFSDDSTIELIVNYVRDITDTVISSETLNFIITKSISDTVIVTEVVGISSDGAQQLTDSTALADSGDITLHDYVDPTYFSSLYVGTFVTF